MKNLSILLSLVTLMSVQPVLSQDTIPNGDFETWYSPTLPKSWQTTNMFMPPGVSTCNRTADSYEGDFALNMKTVDIGIGQLVPAVATLGILGMGYTEGGIAFTSRPESLKLFVKHPSSGDFVQIVVEFFKEGFSIGEGYWSTTDSLGDFTEVVLPIEFINSDYPDTMNIVMLTDQYTLGSNMTVDGLEFGNTTTSIPEEVKVDFNVYPNPCANRIKFTELQDQNYSITIIDLSGRVLLSGHASSNEVDVSSLRAGMYTMIVKTGDKIYSEKFFKVR